MAEKTVKKTTKTTKAAPKAPAVKAEPKVAKTVTEEPTKAATLSIPVLGLDGKETGTVKVPTELFQVEGSPRLIAQYVRVYMANQRQGNASTKRRSEVTGTTKKVYRQKGTGNARHGSMKAPLFVGGGVDSGPKPTDHSLKMNKKQKQRALFSVLSQKVKDNAIAALGKDILEMKPKTSVMVKLLHSIEAGNKKVMFVTTTASKGMTLSLRNLQKVELVNTAALNAYNVMHHDKVLFSEEALTQLSSLYLKK